MLESKELSDLFLFPSASVKQVSERGIRDVLGDVYTPAAFVAFKDSYRTLLNNFQNTMREAGLTP